MDVGVQRSEQPDVEPILEQVLRQRAATHVVVACRDLSVTEQLLQQYRTCAVSGALQHFEKVGQACLETGVQWLVTAKQQSAAPPRMDFKFLLDARVGFRPGPNTIWIQKGKGMQCIGELLDTGMVKAWPAGDERGSQSPTCSMHDLPASLAKKHRPKNHNGWQVLWYGTDSEDLEKLESLRDRALLAQSPKIQAQLKKRRRSGTARTSQLGEAEVATPPGGSAQGDAAQPATPNSDSMTHSCAQPSSCKRRRNSAHDSTAEAGHPVTVEPLTVSAPAPTGCEACGDMPEAPARQASEGGRTNSRQSETEHQTCSAEQQKQQQQLRQQPVATQQQIASLEQQVASLMQQLQGSRAQYEQLQQQVHSGAGLAQSLLLDMRSKEADELRLQLKQQRDSWQADRSQLQADLDTSRTHFAAGITRMEQEAAGMAEQLAECRMQLTQAAEVKSTIQQTVADLQAANACLRVELEGVQQEVKGVQTSLLGSNTGLPALDVEQVRSMLRQEFSRMVPVIVGAPLLTAQATQVYVHEHLKDVGTLPQP